MAVERNYHVALLADANRCVQTLSPTEAATLLGRDDVAFVDVRDSSEIVRDGKIPGAYHIPRGNLEFSIDPASPFHKEVFSSGKRLIFYCALGWRSALSTRTAMELGLEKVAHIGGGFRAWRETGNPVVPAD